EFFLFLVTKEAVENSMIALLFLEEQKYYFAKSLFERYLSEQKEIVIKTEKIDFGFRRFVELGIFVPL
ncbi:hypothetical protein, partial [Enterococcus sp. C76]|uniref:hypothetical protein n=1 Tax=Enterococcus sp. C76 TaxID=3231334 RepID=UPI0034A01F50